MPSPMDEYPIHQTPWSMRYVGSSDRNFYDRAYFNAHDRSGDILFITGLGVYPNLGVTDAFAAVRRGDTQWTLRCSDALGDDRFSPAVGPYRLEILEPLRKVRIICDGAGAGEGDLSFDLTWEGSFPAVMEQHHVLRAGPRPILDASRFAQVGAWSGVLKVGDDEIMVNPDLWCGTRDRSWGIRPVGEAEPGGRYALDEPLEGFWWLYVPMRFEDHAVIVIVQEEPDGFRTLNDATRVHADGRVEQLGWPRIEIEYTPATRRPQRATIELTEPTGERCVLEVDASCAMPLHVGCGYGGDPDWTHGQWRGRDWVDTSVYDLTTPDIEARFAFGVVDHVGRARYEDGREGWGLFEHGTFGRHDPSGFADWDAVAP